GKKVTQQELQPGEVFRVGNSHLRLEIDDGTLPESGAEEAELGRPAGLAPLPWDRLGELSGDTLGHYVLGLPLGRGHHGVVFHATDQRTNQAVALKGLSAEFPADADEMRRFAQALKRLLPLRHPHLVGVHGAGKTGPYCWIALEAVEGDSLAEVIA